MTTEQQDPIDEFERRVGDLARAWQACGINSAGIVGGSTPRIEKVSGWIVAPGSRARFEEVIQKLGPNETVEMLVFDERFRTLFSFHVATEAAKRLLPFLDDDDTVSLGKTAEVEDCDAGDVHSMTLVSPSKADPDNGLLSTISPIGRALLGSKAGDEVEAVTPSGRRRLLVKRLIS